MALNVEEKQFFLDLKKSFNQYKKWIILAVIVLIAPIISYKIYQNLQLNKSENNSIIYERLVNYLDNEKYDSVLDQIDTIKAIGLDEPYGIEMQFLLANAFYHNKQSTEALNILGLIAQNDKTKVFYKNIANLEIMRIYLDNKEYQKVETILNEIKDSALISIKNYYLAQIYLATKRPDLAEQLLTNTININTNNFAFSEILKAQKSLIPQ